MSVDAQETENQREQWTEKLEFGVLLWVCGCNAKRPVSLSDNTPETEDDKKQAMDDVKWNWKWKLALDEVLFVFEMEFIGGVCFIFTQVVQGWPDNVHGHRFETMFM